MLLKNLAKQIFHSGGKHESIPDKVPSQKGLPLRRVLNVGGANKQIPIPAHYDGWDHALLDIQDGPEVDLVMDSRNLRAAVDVYFDAIYCSHNLEHYFAHDVNIVLDGFLNVLKDDGFAEIIVPDIRAVLKRMFENNMDIDDVLYHCPSGPITIQDVVWGWGKQIEESGVDFYAHKIGFTDTYLTKKIVNAGFQNVWTMISPDAMELKAFAFKTTPTDQQRKMLGLPTPD